MASKSANITYWVSTLIFSGLMIYSSIDGIEPSEKAISFLHDMLGYPVYFIRFISIAKIIGSIVILIPGLNRSVKEWAYAGLFFDLIGAIYSGVALSGRFDVQMLFMLAWIVPGVVSYVFWQKTRVANRTAV